MGGRAGQNVGIAPGNGVGLLPVAAKEGLCTVIVFDYLAPFSHAPCCSWARSQRQHRL